MSHSSTLHLTSTIRAILDWEERDTDEGISIMVDNGEAAEPENWGFGTGLGQINDAWYKEIQVPPTSIYTIDILALPVKILNLNLSKELTTLKGLFVENRSGDTYLVIGPSGITEGVSFLGQAVEVGYSGLYEFESDVGVPITASKHKFGIYNPSSTTITCKVLAVGTN